MYGPPARGEIGERAGFGVRPACAPVMLAERGAFLKQVSPPFLIERLSLKGVVRNIRNIPNSGARAKQRQYVGLGRAQPATHVGGQSRRRANYQRVARGGHAHASAGEIG
jgi:hypothetical protein